jgi:hypothetical protein
MKNIKENITRIRNLMFLNEDDNVDVQLNRVKTGSDQQIKQTGPTDDDGDNDAVDGMGEEELDEQEETTTTTTSSITPWESGAQRGPGNPITSAKKEDKTTRSKGNMLGKAGEKWSSGRTMGPTGKNYK